MYVPNSKTSKNLSEYDTWYDHESIFTTVSYTFYIKHEANARELIMNSSPLIILELEKQIRAKGDSLNENELILIFLEALDLDFTIENVSLLLSLTREIDCNGF